MSTMQTVSTMHTPVFDPPMALKTQMAGTPQQADKPRFTPAIALAALVVSSFAIWAAVLLVLLA